jgi:hypothetical protein
MRRIVAAAVGTAALWSLLIGCSDDGDSGSDTSVGTTSPPATIAPGETPFLRVDLIAPAIAAVEEELGGPQRYFEINATPTLVNLFVADEEAGQVIPYTFIDGALTGEAASDAQGNTFASDVIDIDPNAVTARVEAELPDSLQEAFVIEGDAEGAVRYSIVVTSSVGGQLLVVVAGDGTIVSVDALS